MRRTELTRASAVLAFALTLPSAVSSCTYDFDRFERDPSSAGGASGSAGNGSGATGAPAAGSSAAAGSPGGSGGGAGDGASDGGEGGDGTSPVGGTASSAAGTTSSGGTSGAGTAGATRGGASGNGSSGGSGAGGFDCSAVEGTVWNEHCYFVIGRDRGLRWDAARTACSESGSAHLVTVSATAEQAMLEQTFGLGGSDDFWIGLSLENVSSNPDRSCERNPEQCPFRWVSGEPLSYTNWADHSATDREPNYTGACVRVQGDDFRWADLGCTNQLAALCEHDG